MSSGEERWVEVTPSQFPHEDEGLKIVRDLLPVQPPFRAWSNFEFRDNHGRWHEVDLLVLGRRRLHLVELKYYSGVLTGDDYRWRRAGHRPQDSPLRLARHKAQYLASKLQDALIEWGQEKGQRVDTKAIPWVQESIFLHHERFRSELSDAAAIGLYGLDGHTRTSNLPGISKELLEPADPDYRISEQLLVALMKRIGVYQRREREAGPWIITEEPLAEGDGWQEWKAEHKTVRQRLGRIRFQVVPSGAPDSERKRRTEIARHEFTVMDRLSHDGLYSPIDLVESDLGVGLVYPYDEEAERLDLWLAAQDRGVSMDTRLSIIRQIGEALRYAHNNAVVHRGLTPHAIWVRERAGNLRVQVGDWQSAGLARAESTQAAGVTSLVGAGGLTQRSRGTDDDNWQRGAFIAPEGAYGRGSDRVRIDVFGLGALAFYILTGRAPARSAEALRDRLRRQSGLDLSPELPEVPEALRTAVLAATRSAVSERTPDVGRFLAALEESVQRPEEEQTTDPLEAKPGALLDDRFLLIRRLGAGSTALGLLVSDQSVEKAPERVLKVGIDDLAARRLADEAEVLAAIDSPRLVSLVEGPLDVGGRQCLLLQNAGTETLAQAMQDRTRLSLDLLERWGTDLLEAVIALDQAGVDHRDIKPANLGVAENRSDRSKHLVLFDFSLSRAAASALTAGTPPYLDPFLAVRGRYDSAAERYAAAVVLFEMATGSTPVYGDGLSDPAAIPDEATVDPGDFDRTLAQPMVAFFRRALARDVTQRFDTAKQMLVQWSAMFSQTATTIPDDADQLAEAATIDTLLSQAGMSARALSAVEPLRVDTVGQLVAVDPVRLTRLGGVAEVTRKEVRRLAAQWRKKFGTAAGRRAFGSPDLRATTLPAPPDVVETLLAVARKGRGNNRAALAGLIVGMEGSVDAFATHAELGAHLPTPVTPARVSQLLSGLQDDWAADEPALAVLRGLGDQVDAALTDLGGVAACGELVTRLLGAMVPDDASEDANPRMTMGLLRLVVDRQRLVVKGQADTAAEQGSDESDLTPYVQRRRDGRVELIAVRPALLDLADALGQAADDLVDAANPGDEHDTLVPAIRVTETLRAVARDAGAVDTLRDPGRLVTLAGLIARRARASGAMELHDRDLAPYRALAYALGAVAPSESFTPDDLRGRVHARFPALPALPRRPRLDEVVDRSRLGLRFEDDHPPRRYVPIAQPRDTTGLDSRQATIHVPGPSSLYADGAVGQRLADSLARRSFLALGVSGARMGRLVEVLSNKYAVTVVNLSDVLLSALREQAGHASIGWATVLQADAAPAGSRAAQGLTALVDRSLPAVDQAIEAALHADGDAPVLLTDAAPLARHGALARLSPWMDLATHRPRPLWLVVPQVYANTGAMIDRHPLPLAAPGQFVAVDAAWVDRQHEQQRSSDPTAQGSIA